MLFPSGLFMLLTHLPRLAPAPRPQKRQRSLELEGEFLPRGFQGPYSFQGDTLPFFDSARV